MANGILSVITASLILTAGIINCYKIITHKVTPIFSTWIIILVGALLSFITYLIASNQDILAGVLNGADVVSMILVCVTIWFFSPVKYTLKSFEKWYLLGLLGAIAIWFFTRNAFLSNLVIQCILASGYFPTIQNLVRNKRNTESFLVWGLILAASVISLGITIDSYYKQGNILALVYSIRSIVLLGITMLVMAYYSIKSKS